MKAKILSMMLAVALSGSAFAGTTYELRKAAPGIRGNSIGTGGTPTATASCNVPWGGLLSHGATAQVYSKSGAVQGVETCDQLRVTATCNNGNVRYSPSIAGAAYASCQVTAGAACTTPWGTTIASQSHATAFDTPSVPYGQACTNHSAEIGCINGVLGGNTSVYKYANCVVSEPVGCTPPWGGSVVAHGGTIDAYQSSQAPWGGNCNNIKTTLTCGNGSWVGDTSYQYGSCSVAAAANCVTPWGAALAHEASVTAYSTASLPFGGDCETVKGSLSCSNGVVSGDTATYNKASCTVAQPASCATPWGSTFAHGTTVVGYSSTTVPYTASCSDVQATLSCNNGTVSAVDSGSTPVNYNTYTKSSCSVTPAANCTTPWGATLAHGASVAGYTAASSTTSCTPLQGTLSCSNGSLTAKDGNNTTQNSSLYTSASCSVVDSQAASVVRLIHADNSTLDSKSGANMSANGLTYVQGKSGFGSAFQSGSGSSLSIGSMQSSLGTRDFAIEGWAYATSYASTRLLFSSASTWNVGGRTLYVGSVAGETAIRVTYPGKDVVVSGANAYPLNTWFHWAVTRKGNTVRLFVNGVLLATNSSVSVDFNTDGSNALFGNQNGSNQGWVGYMDEMRITIGDSRYTANFDVPTGPFPNP